ncbi:hypothetical protein, partial [Solemya elarraichensis gill symbiont]
TEIDSFSRIYSYGSAGHGPQRWEVQTKSGLVLNYGDSDAVISALSGSHTSWGVKQISDTLDNSIDIEYLTGQGHLQPNLISYANVTVSFEYEARQDHIKVFSPTGSQVTYDQRLSRVKVATGDVTLHTYHLGYRESAILKKSMLEQVTLCADESNCLPPTRFNWTDSDEHWGFDEGEYLAQGYAEGQMYRPTRGSDGVDAMFQDMNGDGWQDRVYDRNPVTETRGLSVSLNDGSGYTTNEFWLSGRFSRKYFRPIDNNDNGKDANLFDMNGDGLVDRVYDANPYDESQKGLHVMYNTGSGLESPLRLLPAQHENWMDALIDGGEDVNGTLLDWNGDGLPERVFDRQYELVTGSWQKTYGISVFLNSESGFYYDGFWDSGFKEKWMAYPTEGGENGNHALFRDMNGDGLPDRVYDRHPQTGVRGYYVTLNNGSGFDDAQLWFSGARDKWMYMPSHNANTAGVDINGDGLTDHLLDRDPYTESRGLTVLLNNGSGFEAPEKWIQDFENRGQDDPYNDGEHEDASLIDVNADGLPDRVFDRNPFTDQEDGHYVMLNTGTGFESGRYWATGYLGDRMYTPTWRDGGAKVMYRDVNADGFPDRVFDRNPHTGTAGLYVTYNKGKQSRIKIITSGLGANISVEYAKSNLVNSRVPGLTSGTSISTPVPAGIVTAVTT